MPIQLQSHGSMPSCLHLSLMPGKAIYGIAQSRTRLKRLSSSSSRVKPVHISCGWGLVSNGWGHTWRVSYIQIHGYQGEGWVEGIVRELGMNMYTLLYLKWITSKVLLYNTGNSLCLMLCNNLNGEKNLKKNKYMYMYNWITLLYTWNYQNFVNQLCSNVK